MNGWEARRQVTVAAAAHAAERDAAVELLEHAAALLARGAPISPEGMREPVRHHLRACAQLCRGHRRVWGLPVVYALEMAAAITGKGDSGGSEDTDQDHDQPVGDQPPRR